jgi:integrase
MTTSGSIFREQLNQALTLSLDLPADPDIDLDFEISSMREDQAQLGKRLAKRHFSGIEKHDAKQLVESLKPETSTVDLDGWDVAYEGILRAKIAKYRYLIAALSGDPAGMAAEDPLFAGLIPDTVLAPDATPNLKQTGTSVQNAIDKFLEKQAKSGVAKKSLADFQRTLVWFGEIVGTGRPVQGLNTQDIKSFRDALELLPQKIGQHPEFAGKGLNDIMKMEHDRPVISAATQKKYFIMLRTFLNWCAAEEIIDKVPGANVKVVSQDTTKKGEAPVHPYSADQLHAIFSSPVYQGCKSSGRRAAPGSEVIKDGYYWVPILGLLTGMRLGEIVQLLVSDIRENKGIIYFDVNQVDDHDKKLKTVNSKRKIPLPRLLKELGFQALVDARRSEKSVRLFPEIACGADGYYSSIFSKWWTRYSRNVSAYNKQTRFHSFRHCFKDAIAGAEVPEAISKALMGHGDTSVHASYGTGPSLDKLKDAIDRATYEVDLKALLTSSSSN